MNYGRAGGIVAAAALAGILAASVCAESRARIVYISFLASPVQIHRSTALLPAHWSAALLNAPVVEGESLRTGDNGEAEVELECGSAVRLAPNSRLTFSHLRRRDDGVTATTVVLERGRFFFSLRHADARDFHVELPGAHVEAFKGVARLQARVSGSKAASLDVTAGQAVVHVGNTVYEVKKSNRIEWTTAGSVRQLPLRAGSDASSEWSRNRDRAFDRSLVASRPSTQVAGAEVYGLPAPGPTLGAPANAFSAWPMLSAGAAAALREPAQLASRPAAVPVCARY